MLKAHGMLFQFSMDRFPSTLILQALEITIYTQQQIIN